MSKSLSISTYSKNNSIKINSNDSIATLIIPENSAIYGYFGSVYFDKDTEYTFAITSNTKYIIYFNELTNLFYIIDSKNITDMDNYIGVLDIGDNYKVNNIILNNYNNKIIVNDICLDDTNTFLVINGRNNILVNFEEGSINIPPIVVVYNNIRVSIFESQELEFNNTTTSFLYFNPNTYLFEVLQNTDIEKVYICTINGYKETITNNILDGVIDSVNNNGINIKSSIVGFQGNICADDRKYYYNDFYSYYSTTSKKFEAGYVQLPVKDGIYIVSLYIKTGKVTLISLEKFDPEYFIILDTVKVEIYNDIDINYYSIKDTRYNNKDRFEDRLSVLESYHENYKLLDSSTEIICPNILNIDDTCNIYSESLITNKNTSIIAFENHSNILYPQYVLDKNIFTNDTYSLLVSDKVTNIKKVKSIKIRTSKNNQTNDKSCLIIGDTSLLTNIDCGVVNYLDTNMTAENLVGIDTREGLSPFLRVATKSEKELFGDYCFTYTGSRNETSYNNSDDKTKDFYIFDPKYYAIKNKIDNIDYFIFNLNLKDSSCEDFLAYDIILNMIRQRYPFSYIGLIPIVHLGYNRFSNFEYCGFMQTIGKKVIKLIDLVDKDMYDVMSIIPTWCYIDPIFSVDDEELNDIGKKQLINSINLWIKNI